MKKTWHWLYSYDKHIFIEKYSLLFLRNPKVASTTIGSLSANFLGIERIPNAINKKLPTIFCSSEEYYKSILYRIAFVRHPLTRLLSCYFQKKQYDRKNFYKRLGISEDISFEGFVDFVCETPDHLADRHFRSQFTFMFDDNANLIPNRIGRFSKFGDDFKSLTDDIGLPAFSIPKTNSSKQKPYLEYYSDKMIEKVVKKYELDFYLFGFEIHPRDEQPILKTTAIIDRLTPPILNQILKYKSKRLQLMLNYAEEDLIQKPKTLKQKLKLLLLNRV